MGVKTIYYVMRSYYCIKLAISDQTAKQSFAIAVFFVVNGISIGSHVPIGTWYFKCVDLC